MTRVQTGLRVDEKLLPRFRELCRNEGFGMGEAIEKFVRVTVEGGSVKTALNGAARLTAAQKEADRATLRTMMLDLAGLIEAGRVEMKSHNPFATAHQTSFIRNIVDSMLGILPRIDDPSFRKETQVAIEMGMNYVREERLHNSNQQAIFR